MFYVLTWFVVFSLLAIWSLAAWALHSIAAWTAANAGVVAGSSGAIEAMRVPDWLAPWMPSELAQAATSILSGFAPAIEAMLHWAPALVGGLVVLGWIIWAVVSAILIALGIFVSRTIAPLCRRATAASSSA